MTPDHEAKLREALPDDRHSRYTLAYLEKISHAGNRALYAKWIWKLWTTPKKDGKPRPIETVYRSLHGPQRFLERLGEKDLLQASNEDFLMAFMKIKKENTRTFDQCQKGSLKRRTLNEYQRECRRMMRHLTSPEVAGATCSYEKAEINDVTPLLDRIIPWPKVHEILQDLTGMNRTMFILATFTGMSIEEVTAIKLDDVWYEATETLIRVERDGKIRDVPVYMYGGAVRSYVAKLRRNDPNRIFLFQRKPAIEPLTRQDVWVRFNKWGQRNGVDGLHAERLRETYCAWLISRGDVNEHFVQHIRGTKKDEGIQNLATEVAELLGGNNPHNFGSPDAPESQFVPGHQPCVECGKQDNPIDPEHPCCGGCGAELPKNPATRETYLISKLARVATEMRYLLGESRNTRAQRAIEQQGNQTHDEEE